MTQDLIRGKKEHRCDDDEYEHHRSCDQRLAAGGPRDFRAFGPHFLNKLEWILHRVFLFGSISRRDLSAPLSVIVPTFAGSLHATAGVSIFTFSSTACRLAGAEGLEPPTPGFGDRCSTN